MLSTYWCNCEKLVVNLNVTTGVIALTLSVAFDVLQFLTAVFIFIFDYSFLQFFHVGLHTCKMHAYILSL